MSVQRVRVLTLNIAHGRGLSTYQGFCGAKRIERNLIRIAKVLNDSEADIVALQEVDEDSHWNRRIHLLDALKRETGFKHSYLGVNNRRTGRLPLAYGNALLSRFPIHRVENTPFGEAVLGEKGFLYAELETPSGRLPVVNLHLDYKSRPRRIEQIRRIIDYLEARGAEHDDDGVFSPIVCGDFNSRSGKPRDAVRHLFAHLTERRAYELHPVKGRTFPSVLPVHGLDFIFAPPKCRVLGSRILRAYVSDHRPVLVDLEMID